MIDFMLKERKSQHIVYRVYLFLFLSLFEIFSATLNFFFKFYYVILAFTRVLGRIFDIAKINLFSNIYYKIVNFVFCEFLFFFASSFIESFFYICMKNTAEFFKDNIVNFIPAILSFR